MNLAWPKLHPHPEPPPIVEPLDVLLEWNGPQVATWSVDGRIFLAVASDDNGRLVRWTAAPVTSEEMTAILERRMPTYDILTSRRVLVFDVDGDGGTRVFGMAEPAELPCGAFPATSSRLPGTAR